MIRPDHGLLSRVHDQAPTARGTALMANDGGLREPTCAKWPWHMQVPTIDMAWPEERCVETIKAACLRTGFFYGAPAQPHGPDVLMHV